MKSETLSKLEFFFKNFSVAMGKASSLAQIESSEESLKLKFVEDYKIFVQRFGGCVIGTKPVYGFENSEMLDEATVVDLTEEYRKTEGGNYTWLIIGFDLAGNYIGIDEGGKIMMYDHDFGKMVILAESFEEYVLTGLAE